MVYPLLPAFVTGVLGAGAVALGTLDGAAEFAAAFVKFGSGRLSDRSTRRGPLIVVGYVIGVVVRPVIAVTAAAWQVIGLRVVDRVGKGIRTPPRDALIADVTPLELRGRAFGLQRGMDHAGAVLGPLVAFWLLTSRGTDVRGVITASVVPGILVLVLAMMAVGRGGGRADSGAPDAHPAAAPAARPPGRPTPLDPNAALYLPRMPRRPVRRKGAASAAAAVWPAWRPWLAGWCAAGCSRALAPRWRSASARRAAPRLCSPGRWYLNESKQLSRRTRSELCGSRSLSRRCCGEAPPPWRRRIIRSSTRRARRWACRSRARCASGICSICRARSATRPAPGSWRTRALPAKRSRPSRTSRPSWPPRGASSSAW